MNCNEALRILLLPTHDDRDEAVDHVLSHPTCLARVEQLRRAITVYPADEPACAEVQSQLAAYFAQEADHGDETSVYPMITAHLARCPFCRIEYGAIQKAMGTLTNGTLRPVMDPVTDEVQFDLSFLEEENADPFAALWQINGKVHRLIETVKIALSETSARIDAVFPAISPQLHLQPMRGQDDIRYSVIALPDEIGQIRFHFEVKPAAHQTAHVLLTLLDTITDQPLANLRIALRKSDGTMITSSLTDEQGRFVLPQMTIGNYLLHIRTDEESWELPIVIEAAAS